MHGVFAELCTFEGVIPVLVDDGAARAEVCAGEQFDAKFVVEKDGEVTIGHAVCGVEAREIDYGV